MPYKEIHTEKIKIIRIITRLNIGGPAIHTILLNEGLNDGEFDSRLIAGRCDKDEGDMTYLADEQGINLIVIPQLKREIDIRNDLIAFIRIFNLIRKEKPHIVHTHMAKAGVLGRLAATLLRVPVKVHTFHGHVFHSYFSAAKTKTFLFIERIIAKFTDQIIVVSVKIKDEICERFRLTEKEKISVIGLGLDLKQFENISKNGNGFKKKLGINKDALLVGIIGRLTAVKNHRLFLDAIGLLKEEVPDLNANFLIIGDGELREELESYATALNIKDWIRFVGWQKDMPAVYADLDIVTLTSFNEGTPLALIEAAASQKAVIATSVGGVPDLFENGKTGLLIKSNDPLQLKDVILTLLRDEQLRKKLGQAGRLHVCDTYSKERLIKDIRNCYKRLLLNKGIIN